MWQLLRNSMKISKFELPQLDDIINQARFVQKKGDVPWGIMIRRGEKDVVLSFGDVRVFLNYSDLKKAKIGDLVYSDENCLVLSGTHCVGKIINKIDGEFVVRFNFRRKEEL